MSYSYLPINKVTRRRREYAKPFPDINRDRQLQLRSNEGEDGNHRRVNLCSATSFKKRHTHFSRPSVIAKDQTSEKSWF